MIEKFSRYIFEVLKVHPNDKLLLTVSGGVDSMCLWALCRELNLNYIVAHCNFKLRGADSDEDEHFVLTYKQEGELVLSNSFKTKNFAHEHKISTQMAARELRYDWFKELQKEHNCRYLVTAHHLDDQVETFFIQLLRNADPWNLKGMPIKTDSLIRPLMFANKEEIKMYVSENKIPFREDCSNDDDYYLRNQIRHHLVPVLEKIDGGKNAVIEATEDIRSLADHLDAYFAGIEKEIITESNDVVTYLIEPIKSLDLANLFLKRVLLKFGFNKKLSHQLFDALHKQSGKEFFSRTHRILIDRQNLIVEKLKLNEVDEIILNIDELLIAENQLVNSCKFNRTPDFEPFAVNNRIYMDFNKLKNPISFRKWREGDWFIPFGMEGRKKLSDYFIDQKFSRIEKERQWIMTSGEEICWIVGNRMDDRFKITEKTRLIISLDTI